MDSEQRFWISIWAIVGTLVLALAIVISVSISKNLPYYTQERIACIQAHGTWGPMAGSTSEETCIAK